jgi:hypothetical protein
MTIQRAMCDGSWPKRRHIQRWARTIVKDVHRFNVVAAG